MEVIEKKKKFGDESSSYYQWEYLDLYQFIDQNLFTHEFYKPFILTIRDEAELRFAQYKERRFRSTECYRVLCPSIVTLENKTLFTFNIQFFFLLGGEASLNPTSRSDPRVYYEKTLNIVVLRSENQWRLLSFSFSLKEADYLVRKLVTGTPLMLFQSSSSIYLKREEDTSLFYLEFQSFLDADINSVLLYAVKTKNSELNRVVFLDVSVKPSQKGEFYVENKQIYYMNNIEDYNYRSNNIEVYMMTGEETSKEFFFDIETKRNLTIVSAVRWTEKMWYGVGYYTHARKSNTNPTDKGILEFRDSLKDFMSVTGNKPKYVADEEYRFLVFFIIFLDPSGLIAPSIRCSRPFIPVKFPGLSTQKPTHIVHGNGDIPEGYMFSYVQPTGLTFSGDRSEIICALDVGHFYSVLIKIPTINLFEGIDYHLSNRISFYPIILIIEGENTLRNITETGEERRYAISKNHRLKKFVISIGRDYKVRVLDKKTLEPFCDYEFTLEQLKELYI